LIVVWAGLGISVESVEGTIATLNSMSRSPEIHIRYDDAAHNASEVVKGLHQQFTTIGISDV